MKKISILGCILLFVSTHIFSQKQESELFNLLQNGQYRQLVNKVCSLREKEYFKNAFMDYCLAYGYCKLSKPTLAGEWFDHILASYNNLSTVKRNELHNLKQSCTNTSPAATGGGGSTNKLFEFLRSMSTESFEGNDTGIESKMGFPSFSDTITEFDFEHLTFDAENRKFTVDQKRQALLYYRDIIGNRTFVVDTTAHFLIFYPRNALSIQSHIRQLEEYYEYYRHTFSLEQSNRLITIFYCTNREDFNETAELVHNIPVPKSTFGYASSADLVMMGIANFAWLGAMKHELFHLMIRSFIGDIPPWLDEGTACYFESSDLRGNSSTTNFSGSNYRVRMLREIETAKREIKYRKGIDLKIPRLTELINYNWQQFTGNTGDLTIKAGFNQSLSYAFITFLSERNLLVKTIDAFRHRSYTEPESDAGSDGLIILHVRSSGEIVESVTGIKLETLESEFKAWCGRKNITIR